MTTEEKITELEARVAFLETMLCKRPSSLSGDTASISDAVRTLLGTTCLVRGIGEFKRKVAGPFV